MPGSATAIRQERLKKASVRPNTPVLFTINEEDEQQKNCNSKRLKGNHCLSRSAVCRKKQISCFDYTADDVSILYLSGFCCMGIFGCSKMFRMGLILSLHDCKHCELLLVLICLPHEKMPFNHVIS